ncbi:MAG TPA: hypothetical protein VH092_27560, partial [Urbifossiella sp.]|nr:hypothetical protein [Urbifossiella sp.]
MTPPPTDRADPATLAAAEGQAALGRGDTALARAKFVEAGDILLREVRGTPGHADQTLLRFLAATQFYKGGEYRRALDLSKKLEARLLPKKTRDLLPTFRRDAATRTDPGYRGRMRDTCARLWAAGEYRQILDLLKDHPYVYDTAPLAFIRAVLCEELGQWKAAAVFYAKAIPGAEDGSDFMLMAVGRALGMPAEGRVEEAWENIRHLRDLFPNATTNIAASFVAFFRASRMAGAERQALLREQVQYFEEGWRAYLTLPPATRLRPVMRHLVTVGFGAAAVALRRLGERDRLRILVDEVTRREVDSPAALTARGMLTYPSQEAVADFERAAALPNPGYFPFLYLAHHALRGGRIAECERLCREALLRNPSPAIQARLYGWIAVCRDRVGVPRAEVEDLFRQALEIDPDNDQVRANYRIFRETAAAV